ncbi:MAG: hypothetical protein HY344_00985 [Candidatus Levybacteria bacterium]|nr:hypothetical protein [Candidatus Levybacteria bacterium]
MQNHEKQQIARRSNYEEEIILPKEQKRGHSLFMAAFIVTYDTAMSYRLEFPDRCIIYTRDFLNQVKQKRREDPVKGKSLIRTLAGALRTARRIRAIH